MRRMATISLELLRAGPTPSARIEPGFIHEARDQQHENERAHEEVQRDHEAEHSARECEGIGVGVGHGAAPERTT